LIYILLFLIIPRSVFSYKQYLNHDHKTSLQYNNRNLNVNSNKRNFNVQNYSIKYIIDAKKKSCDMQVVESVNYMFTKPTRHIIHVVLSKKLPYYDIQAFSKTNRVMINKISVVRSNIMQDDFISRNFHNFYRYRWIYSIELNKEISNVAIDYEYMIERAIFVDPTHELDIIKIGVINPFNFQSNLNFTISIQNFNNLTPNQIRSPPSSKVTYKGNNKIEINTQRTMPVYGQILMQFSLPMEISVCEPKLVFTVYVGMIAMTTLFLVFSLIAFFYIYKE